MYRDLRPAERPVLSNPENPAPSEVLDRQVALEVLHMGFDGKIHSGIIEVDEAVAGDVLAFFEHALYIGFPIEKVTRASDPAYGWDDDKLMAGNVTSGFNYRTIAGTDKESEHARGAFDVNPRLNPYVRYTEAGEVVAPPGAVWDPPVPGTLYAGHPLVDFMEVRGWEWGGRWTSESGRTDYQHFQRNPD